MPRREIIGGDVTRLQQQVGALLDAEDGLIVLFDGTRFISYASGLGLSACQLELLAADIERLIRAVAAGPVPSRVDDVQSAAVAGRTMTAS